MKTLQVGGLGAAMAEPPQGADSTFRGVRWDGDHLELHHLGFSAGDLGRDRFRAPAARFVHEPESVGGIEVY